MKAFLARPGFLGQAGTVGADLSYALALLFTGLFIYAWFLARRGEGTRHHNLILISMPAMLVYFVVYYLFRQLGVLALEGKEGFGGPQSVYDNVFIPILSLHLFLVSFGLIMAVYMVVQGIRVSVKTDARYTLRAGELRVSAKTFRSVMLGVAGLWLLSLAVNIFVRRVSTLAVIAWTIIFATIALVTGLERLIERWLPDGAQRHRVLGRGTMVIFALLLATSTLTYLLLYVIYPVKHS